MSKSLLVGVLMALALPSSASATTDARGNFRMTL